MIASASSGEATHEELKQAGGRSNKQGEAAMQQVCHTGPPADVWTAAQMEKLQQAPVRLCTASSRADPAGLVTAVIAAFLRVHIAIWAFVRQLSRCTSA